MESSKQNYSLVILAGGLGSRYKGQKQLDSIGPSEESLMEYSLYDAISVGFTKVVLIINRFFEEDTKNYFLKIAKKNNITIHFIYQEIAKEVPVAFGYLLEKRTKPWGTAHAILMAKEVIQESFVVINADDFYGKLAYKKMYKAISESKINAVTFKMIAYPVSQTLSENGFVSRGICQLDKDNFLQKVTEQTHIILKENKITYQEDNIDKILEPNTLVSMNFWAFHPILFDYLENQFHFFLKNNNQNNSQEFYIPEVMDTLIRKKKIKVKVMLSDEKWFGITYPEDKKTVESSIRQLVVEGKYPHSLWK